MSHAVAPACKLRGAASPAAVGGAKTDGAGVLFPGPAKRACLHYRRRIQGIAIRPRAASIAVAGSGAVIPGEPHSPKLFWNDP